MGRPSLLEKGAIVYPGECVIRKCAFNGQKRDGNWKKNRYASVRDSSRLISVRLLKVTIKLHGSTGPQKESQ